MFYQKVTLVVLGLALCLAHAFENTTQRFNTLNLDEAIQKALTDASDLKRLQAKIKQADFLSQAADSLPDPKISLSFANLPVDSFDFSQENMTQLKLGVSQMFPRGDSQGLMQKSWLLLSKADRYHLSDIRTNIIAQVEHRWLEAYRAQKSIQLIKENRFLFEQASKIAEASYTSGLLKNRQQDLIRAQLELTRLDDRLFRLKQQARTQLQALSRWFDSHTENQWEVELVELNALSNRFSTQLFLQSDKADKYDWILEHLQRHPAVAALSTEVSQSNIKVAIAEQAYKPQWGVNASYGFRDDSPGGMDRSDFFSIGVTFDLPIFTSGRQDPQLKAVSYEAQTKRYIRQDKIKNLFANMMSTIESLRVLNERKHLFEIKLIPQLEEQSEASLKAYTNDDGDFNEVVRSRIDLLNAKIDYLNIRVDFFQAVAVWNYFLTTVDSSGSDNNEVKQ
ncbi:TolC family protein [Pleionea sediminis]|uniref:TolC family protein n=1 Tax=Pleionea sediminis TaxID=2569479 RepID=UPI00118651F9|nr:TolC family protein [Pleionea sediminis]